MNRNIQKQVEKCNAEIARLKELIPGLKCSDKMMTSRRQMYVLVGLVDESWTEFCVDSQHEEPQVLAQRLLDGHITSMNRLHENILALKEIVNAQ